MLRDSRKRIGLTIICLVVFLMASLAPLAQASGSYNPNTPESLAARDLRAEAALVMESSTGEVLFEKNADELRPPASTTKVLTALLALTMGEPDSVVTVSPYAASLDKEQHSLIGLQAGEQVPLKVLIKAMMVESGNDGALAIAEHI